MAQRKSGGPSVSRSAYVDGAASNRKPSRLVAGDGPITEGGAGDKRRLEGTVTEWNDHAPTGEKPDDARTPEQAEADKAQALAAADGGFPVTVTSRDREETDKAKKIRELLSSSTRLEERGEDGTPVAPEGEGGETEEGGEEKTAAKTDDTAPPSRKERIAGIDAKVEAERRRVATERELANERAKRQELEATLNSTDVLAFAKRRGLTKDQALDAILNANEAAEAAGQATPDPMKAVNDRLAHLEAREREVNRREAMAITERVTAELDIPVTRASKRVSVQGEDGSIQVMSGIELVTATARRLWEQAGQPEGGVAAYLKEAAPLVEEQLIADQRDVLEAYAAKHGSKPAAAAPAKPAPKPAPPAIGRRTGAGGGGASSQAPAALPDDPDERHKAIKARYGWT